MNSIIQFLAKPFPQEESYSETVWIIFAISLFVFFFLYVFRPFGIHQIKSGLFLLCLGFGLVTFVASIIYEVIAVKILKIKGHGANFSYGRWILYFFGAMLTISVGNFLFVRLAVIGHIDWSLFPYMIRGTVAVGFFPVVVLGAIALLKQEKKYQNLAEKYTLATVDTESPSEPNEQSVFDIPSSRIRYIEGMQNYVKIGYLDKTDEFKVRTERATLKSISEASQDSALSRCHRSFFVNKESISSVAGNAQGLLLSLLNCDKEIPVSRRYIADFKHN